MGLLDSPMMGGGLLGLSPQALGVALMANSGPSRMPHSMFADFGNAAMDAQGVQARAYQNQLMSYQLPMMAQRMQLVQDAMDGTGGFAGGQGTPQGAAQAAPSQGAGPVAGSSGGGAFPFTGNPLRDSIIADVLGPTASKIVANRYGAPINVRPGGAVFDPVTGQVRYQQPQLPQGVIYNPSDQSVSPIAGSNTQAATLEGIKQGAETAGELARKRGEVNIDLGPYAPAAPAYRSALANATMTPTAAQPQTSPLMQGPLKTDAGTTIPSLQDAAPLNTSPLYLKERIPQWAKTENAWAEALPSNLVAEQRGLAIADALKKTESGSWATEKASVKAGLKAAGIDLPDSMLGDPAQVQRALKDNFAQTLATIKAFSNRPAAAEVLLGQKNYSNPNLQPEANLAIISETVGQMRWERAMLNDWTRAKALGWKDPQDFQRAWTAQNPLQGFIDQTKAQIGPLKGMPGGPGGVPTVPKSLAGVQGLQFSPSRNQYRDSSGKIYDSLGNEVK